MRQTHKIDDPTWDDILARDAEIERLRDLVERLGNIIAEQDAILKTYDIVEPS